MQCRMWSTLANTFPVTRRCDKPLPSAHSGRSPFNLAQFHSCETRAEIQAYTVTLYSDPVVIYPQRYQLLPGAVLFFSESIMFSVSYTSRGSTSQSAVGSCSTLVQQVLEVASPSFQFCIIMISYKSTTFF